MSVLGYWFLCAYWLWGQGDMDAGAPACQCLGEEGPLGERQPLGCRDCRRWWAWETQCTRTSLFGTSLPKCPLAELQQQKLRNWACEMLNLPSLSERKRNVFAFIVSPSVDTAIYLQILLSLKSLHTHLYRGSSFLFPVCSWKRVSIYLWHAASCKLNQLLLKALRLDHIDFTVIQEALITETERSLVRKHSRFSWHVYYKAGVILKNWLPSVFQMHKISYFKYLLWCVTQKNMNSTLPLCSFLFQLHLTQLHLAWFYQFYFWGWWAPSKLAISVDHVKTLA